MSLSILDLRRGDADDNRTSPYGRGWRSVIVSTALEFNYLTASIAFVALIIVPALLVGLEPPLLFTYGRQKLDAAAVIGSCPVVALFSLATLVGLALWIGRPLLARTVENLWHLHYTLVFPLFVGLREPSASRWNGWRERRALRRSSIDDAGSGRCSPRRCLPAGDSSWRSASDSWQVPRSLMS